MNLDYIRLQALNPEFDGRMWAAYQTFMVGRAEGLELCLADDSVSRHHAEVISTPDGWVVYDLGSTNRTYVNEHLVGDEGRRLRLGDRLRFGLMVLMVVELEELALDEDHRASIHYPGRRGAHRVPHLQPQQRDLVKQGSDVEDWERD